MGYYTRVLSKRSECPSFETLKAQLKSKRPDVVLSLEDGEPAEWLNLLLSHADGLEIAAIERNVVVDGELGAEELSELVETVSTCKPESGAKWLLSFLEDVRVIYAFQHLSGTEETEGYEALAVVSDAVGVGGEAILQADSEGFYNEDGHPICGVIGPSQRDIGRWRCYKIADG